MSPESGGLSAVGSSLPISAGDVSPPISITRQSRYTTNNDNHPSSPPDLSPIAKLGLSNASVPSAIGRARSPPLPYGPRLDRNLSTNPYVVGPVRSQPPGKHSLPPSFVTRDPLNQVRHPHGRDINMDDDGSDDGLFGSGDFGEGDHRMVRSSLPRREETRMDVRRARIESEQRRRDLLREGFKTLKDVLPSSGQRASKSSLLDRGGSLFNTLGPFYS